MVTVVMVLVTCRAELTPKGNGWESLWGFCESLSQEPKKLLRKTQCMQCMLLDTPDQPALHVMHIPCAQLDCTCNSLWAILADGYKECT